MSDSGKQWRSREECEAEKNERLQSEYRRLLDELAYLADCIREHLPADVPEGSSVAALVVAAAQREQRLRAALALFADESAWYTGASGAWLTVGNSVRKPWTVAQEALSPPKPEEAPDA